MIERNEGGPADGDGRGESSLDGIFDVLGHPTRRRIVTRLVDDASRAFDPAAFETEGERGRRFRTSLYHVHFPRLEDAGYVEWDRETNTIRRGGAYEDIARVVELLRTNSDRLPGSWP